MKEKKYIIIMGLVIIILLSIIIGNTVAKYITSKTGTTDINIASWQVLVNNTDVTSAATLNNVITPIFPGTNNIASGVIAPTAEGYFDILIDASNADVSLSYEITTSPNQSSIVTDLVMSGYAIDSGTRQPVIPDANDEFKVTGTILHNSQDRDVNIRVYIKWNDDSSDGATMTNSEDTATTLAQESVAKINVNLKFTQLPSNVSSTGSSEVSS